MENYKFYVPTTKDNQKIRFTLSYLKPSEGTSWATSQQRETGYRITGVPVEISGNIESYGAFTGFGDTVLPCKRRSEKRRLQAITEFEKKLPTYVQYFINKGFEIPEDARKEIFNQHRAALQKTQTI